MEKRMVVLPLNPSFENTMTWGRRQSGAWAFKKSLMRPLFFLYLQQIRNIQSHWPGCQSALRLPTHVPGPHMWVSAFPGPSTSSPKQWKSDGCVKIYNSLSVSSEALCPCARPAHVGKCLPSGSHIAVLRFTTLSALDSHWQNPRNEKL